MRKGRLRAEGKEMCDQQLNDTFSSFYTSPRTVARARYDKTIVALREAFSPEEVYVGFYETLFSESALRELSQFLSLELSSADTQERVNSSKPVALRKEIYESCRTFHSEVYSFCAVEYPVTSEIWPDRASLCD
jgi:hypothetical protein